MAKLAPWQIWRADLDPSEGHEQGKTRPVVIVSSPFHLRLTGNALITVLPLTTVDRPGLLHRVPLTTKDGTSYVITEQIRTISRKRLVGQPLLRLDPRDVAQVREVLGQMIDL